MSRIRAWAVIVVAVAAVAMVPSAHAHAQAASPGELYYSNGTEIMRVPVAGGTPRQVVNTREGSVTGMAIGDGQLFWVAEISSDQPIDFTSVTDPGSVHTLITGLNFPDGLLAAGGWLYYVDQNAIGRVRFNGTGLNRHFINLPQQNGGGVADGLATDGTYLYFSRCQNDEIGRVTLSGAGLTMAFIKLPKFSCPQQLAVGNTHIYWTELAAHVGRAALNGQGASVNWLNIRENDGPFNVAADNTNVYWDWGGSAGSPYYVGTASAGGTGVRTQYLSGEGAFLLTAPGAS
jgi:hypothetical protein